jgi:hypothetical protein
MVRITNGSKINVLLRRYTWLASLASKTKYSLRPAMREVAMGDCGKRDLRGC